MKLRYYLRGLGIGIIVTALIMGIAVGDARPLTDAEIRAAAQQLGMVEGDSLRLSDIQQSSVPVEDEGEPEETVPEESGAGPESGSEEASSESVPGADGEEPGETAPEESGESSESGSESIPGADGEEPGETVSRESGADPENANGVLPEGSTVTITVEAGSGSRTVCNQLADAGLIEDAAAFDRYLIENGYSKRICVGAYEIEPGTDEEQIAKIITKTK